VIRAMPIFEHSGCVAVSSPFSIDFHSAPRKGRIA
jgi:hypothetical protein